MSVEILTVSLSDETIARLATAVGAHLLGHPAVTQSNPPSAPTPQGAAPPALPQQADPWQNGGQPQTAPQQGQGAYNPAAQQQYPQGPQPPQAPARQGPMCVHGPMRYVAAGFSQSTGRSYQAFYGCPQPRGAQDKCASVKA